MFLQRVYAFFLYVRKKIFGSVFENPYASVSETEDIDEAYAESTPFSALYSKEENENQCVVFFDSENGMMYNKL